MRAPHSACSASVHLARLSLSMRKNYRAHLLPLTLISLMCIGPRAAAQPLPVEPVALPPAVEQGVDMVYIDPEIAGNIRWRNTKLDDVSFARYAGLRWI